MSPISKLKELKSRYKRQYESYLYSSRHKGEFEKLFHREHPDNKKESDMNTLDLNGEMETMYGEKITLIMTLVEVCKEKNRVVLVGSYFTPDGKRIGFWDYEGRPLFDGPSACNTSTEHIIYKTKDFEFYQEEPSGNITLYNPRYGVVSEISMDEFKLLTHNMNTFIKMRE